MRKPMVTRTVKSTEVKVMALDTTTDSAVEKTYNIVGTFKTDAKLLKAVQAAFDTDELKHVHIVDSTELEELYGMDMYYFLAHAVHITADRKTEA